MRGYMFRSSLTIIRPVCESCFTNAGKIILSWFTMSNALVKSRNNPTCTFLIKSWNNAIGTSLLSSVLLFYVVCSMQANNCKSLYVLITLVIPEFSKLRYQSNISEEFGNMIWCSSHVQTLLFGRNEGFSLAEFLCESLVS